MRFSLAATLLVLTASLTFAQNRSKEKICAAASATTVGHDAGVIIRGVLLRLDRSVGSHSKESRTCLSKRQREREQIN